MPNATHQDKLSITRLTYTARALLLNDNQALGRGKLHMLTTT